MHLVALSVLTALFFQASSSTCFLDVDNSIHSTKDFTDKILFVKNTIYDLENQPAQKKKGYGLVNVSSALRERLSVCASLSDIIEKSNCIRKYGGSRLSELDKRKDIFTSSLSETSLSEIPRRDRVRDSLSEISRKDIDIDRDIDRDRDRDIDRIRDRDSLSEIPRRDRDRDRIRDRDSLSEISKRDRMRNIDSFSEIQKRNRIRDLDSSPMKRAHKPYRPQDNEEPSTYSSMQKTKSSSESLYSSDNAADGEGVASRRVGHSRIKIRGRENEREDRMFRPPRRYMRKRYIKAPIRRRRIHHMSDSSSQSDKDDEDEEHTESSEL